MQNYGEIIRVISDLKHFSSYSDSKFKNEKKNSQRVAFYIKIRGITRNIKPQAFNLIQKCLKLK